MTPIILDLCGGSGAWSAPYKEAGYDVRVITLPEDVRGYDPPLAHGILAAPPCTEFASTGARWWKEKDPLLLLEALSVVRACQRVIDEAQPVWWALENPVGRLSRWLGPARMTFQPCEYGDPWTKRTCLWGEFISPVKTPVPPTRLCKHNTYWLHCARGGKNEKTMALRSVTPPGFAQAFFRANP